MTSWRRHEVASAYLDGVRRAIPQISVQIDLLRRLIDAALPSVERFVDLGCGDGALGASVLDWYPGAEVFLVDFSLPMLDRARARFKDDSHDVVFVSADLRSHDWLESIPKPGEFDLVISGYAIHHLEDWRKQELFAEILTLLRPGGLFVNLEHVAPRSHFGRKLFDDLFVDSLHRFAMEAEPIASRDRVEFEYHSREDQYDNILSTVESQCGWLRAAGFVDVDCYFKLLELAIIAGRKPV